MPHAPIHVKAGNLGNVALKVAKVEMVRIRLVVATEAHWFEQRLLAILEGENELDLRAALVQLCAGVRGILAERSTRRTHRRDRPSLWQYRAEGRR